LGFLIATIYLKFFGVLNKLILFSTFYKIILKVHT